MNKTASRFLSMLLVLALMAGLAVLTAAATEAANYIRKNFGK